MITTDILNNMDLVRKLAWRFARRSPVWEFDDILSEACVAYLEGEQTYDPGKGAAKSTYLWTYINNHLVNRVLETHNKFTSREAATDVYDLQVPALSGDPLAQLAATAHWLEFYESLTPEGQEICDILLDPTSCELPVNTPKLCRGRLRDELRARGWSWSAIWDSYRDIKNALAASGSAVGA